MFTFGTSITLAIMAFVFAVGTLLILIQSQILDVATEDAASAYMDAASATTLGQLHAHVSEIASLVGVPSPQVVNTSFGV